MRSRPYAPAPPPIVSSDLTATEDGTAPPRVHATRPPRAWEERRLERERQSVALLNMFNQMLERLGGILDLEQAALSGDVLGAMSQVIPPAGVLTRNWKQPAAAVAVANHSPVDVMVTGATVQGAAPGVGTGVFRVPAGTLRVLILRSPAISLYGLAGALVDVVAFARPREPFSAMLNAGPLDGVVVPAGATTSQTVLLTGNLERLVIVQNVSAFAAGSLTTTINGVSPSGYVWPLLVGAALVAVGTTPLRVGPGLTAAANSAANDVVPRVVQVVATVAAGVTYGIDVVAGR